MKLFSQTSEERNHYFILAALFCAAFALRLAVVLFTSSVPGDGPGRASAGYIWARAPHFVTYGNWLPGYPYLVGLFSFIFEDPLLSSRILNLGLGTLTIPLFYLLLRKIYDPLTALISAALLTFFPLHIGMSGGSLSEVSFAFEVIAGTLLLIISSEKEVTRSRIFYLASALLFLCLAIMSRYEIWVLIPIFPLYYFLKTRRTLESCLILAVLFLFPFMWSLNTYIHVGDPFLGFTKAKKYRATKDSLWG
jgi:4-amino-4-deoxy-L-arabinose transferase-like glycosyltransferase